MKDTRITETTRLEFRFEFFNFFNHTQFDPNGIDTDFNSSSFGTETAARAPRLIQLAGEVLFLNFRGSWSYGIFDPTFEPEKKQAALKGPPVIHIQTSC